MLQESLLKQAAGAVIDDLLYLQRQLQREGQNYRAEQVGSRVQALSQLLYKFDYRVPK